MSESYDDARGVLGDLAVITNRTRQAITPRTHRWLRVWGLVHLVGFGALWADIVFRDGRSPVFGLTFLGAAGLAGFASTRRELKRLRGLSGASQRAVFNLWTSWGLAVVAWWVLFGLYISLQAGQTVASTCATAAALAVVLTGAWLLTSFFHIFIGCVGMGLVISGLIGLQIPSGGYAMLFLWVATSLILLLGSVVAQSVQPLVGASKS